MPAVAKKAVEFAVLVSLRRGEKYLKPGQFSRGGKRVTFTPSYPARARAWRNWP